MAQHNWAPPPVPGPPQIASPAASTPTMSNRVLLIRECGGPEVVLEETLPLPQRGAGQVLVKTVSAGVVSDELPTGPAALV